MIKKFYKAIFDPQEEGGYTVTVPALPGCISEGDTYEEALANIKEAIDLYLESLQADGILYLLWHYRAIRTNYWFTELIIMDNWLVIMQFIAL